MHISNDGDHIPTMAIVRTRATPTSIIDARAIIDKGRTFSSWPSPAREMAQSLDSTIGHAAREHPLQAKTLVSVAVAMALSISMFAAAIAADEAAAQESVSERIAGAVTAELEE